jgi:hypothetical protein
MIQWIRIGVRMVMALKHQPKIPAENKKGEANGN